MASSSRPGSREIEQAVPVNVIETRQEQLGGALQTELLDFFRAEGRCADFGHPDRFCGDSAAFVELARPLVDVPMIPIEGEAMAGYDIQVLEFAKLVHAGDKCRMDWRDAS